MKKFLNILYRFSSSWTGTVIIVLFLIFFVAQSFVIPSGSMKRTQLIGDFLFAKKFSYGIPTPHLPWLEIPILPDFNNNGHLIEGPRPKREDIVIFRYPKNHKIHYVKRCVAVGGDEVIYADKKLLIHFHEGNEYIKKTYPEEKIISLRGKLWVENPYMGTYPGIQYEPEGGTIFEALLQYYSYNKEIDMTPVMVEGLNSPVYELGSKVINALYSKVDADHFYMMGDNREKVYKGENGGRDHAGLKRVCSDVDIESKECEDLWNKQRFNVRWGRVGRLIESIQLDEPIQ